MDEAKFDQLAGAELSAIEAEVLRVIEHTDSDADVQLSDGGILEIELADGGKIVINRHAPMQEIWLAARTGAYHFRRVDTHWCDTREGTPLREVLARVLAASAEGLRLDPHWVAAEA